MGRLGYSAVETEVKGCRESPVLPVEIKGITTKKEPEPQRSARLPAAGENSKGVARQWAVTADPSTVSAEMPPAGPERGSWGAVKTRVRRSQCALASKVSGEPGAKPSNLTGTALLGGGLVWGPHSVFQLEQEGVLSPVCPTTVHGKQMLDLIYLTFVMRS